MSHTDFDSLKANSKIIKVGENDRDRCLERNTHVYSLLSFTPSLWFFLFPSLFFPSVTMYDVKACNMLCSLW